MMFSVYDNEVLITELNGVVPDTNLAHLYDDVVELTEEEHARVVAAFKEFWEVQSLIHRNLKLPKQYDDLDFCDDGDQNDIDYSDLEQDIERKLYKCVKIV